MSGQLTAVAFIAALLAACGASPSFAANNLDTAFASLDVDGDGKVSRDEFLAPKNAHEVIVQGIVKGDHLLAVAGQPGSGAQVQYTLTVPGGDVGLLIAIDPPGGRLTDQQLRVLVGDAFDRLDGNKDGSLDRAEFSR